MEITKSFTKDWRSTFSNAPLPDLKCLTSGDPWENLDEDEVELETKQKAAQEALDQIVFCVRWVRQKKEELRRSIAEEKDNGYEKMHQSSHSENENNYYNVQPKKTPKVEIIRRSLTESALFTQRTGHKMDNSRPPEPSPRQIAKTKNSLRRVATVDNSVSNKQNAKADMNSEVSEDKLRIISTKIADSFMLFGSESLGFTQSELEMCQSMSDDKNKQALRMLLKWKRRMGCLATTEELLRLLRGHGYDNSVWGILADFKEMSSSKDELPENRKEFEPYQTCVIKDYLPTSSDEISVKKGDSIKIQDKGRNGWYYGNVGDKSGWIPKNCVGEEEPTGRLQFRFRVQTSTECELRSQMGNVRCKKGEDLDVIEETSILSRPCYRVRNRDGLVSVVPIHNCRKSLQSNSVLWERNWFHHGLSRREAETKLKSWPEGAFLIREASNMPGNFVLSVRTRNDVANFMITCHSYGYTVYNHDFSSLEEMIEYYQKNIIRDGLFLKSSV